MRLRRRSMVDPLSAVAASVVPDQSRDEAARESGEDEADRQPPAVRIGSDDQEKERNENRHTSAYDYEAAFAAMDARKAGPINGCLGCFRCRAGDHDSCHGCSCRCNGEWASDACPVTCGERSAHPDYDEAWPLPCACTDSVVADRDCRATHGCRDA